MGSREKFVKIVTTAPRDAAEKVRIAMGDAGGGIVGQYSHCSFSSIGEGRFRPGDGANPTIGSIGQSEIVEEERIEITCEKEKAEIVAQAIRDVHPYEEVIIDMYDIESL